MSPGPGGLFLLLMSLLRTSCCFWGLRPALEHLLMAGEMNPFLWQAVDPL